MSLPNEPDYVVVRLGDGASPEVFDIVCGFETAGINQTANTSDRFRRDCATPADVPLRTVRVTGLQWDLTASGVLNMDMIEDMQAALGNRRSWRIEYGKFDDAASIPRTGTIYGRYDGRGVLTAFNANTSGEEASAEVTIAGEGRPTWTLV